MVHEPLEILEAEPVDFLLILTGTDGDDRERLGLSASEQRRPVGAGQDAHLGPDGPDLVGAAPVRTDALVEDRGADGLLDLGLVRLGDVGTRIGKALLEGGDRLLLELIEGGLARGLVRVASGAADARCDVLVHGCGDVRRHLLGWIAHRRLADRIVQAALKLHELADLVVRHAQRLEHRLLGDLMRSGLHHDDGIPCSGDDQVERRLVQLREGRVEHQLSVEHADAHAGDRAAVRDAADLQRARRAGDRESCRVLLLVGAQHRCDDLHVIAKVLGEERPHGTVDHPARDGRGLARPPLASRERSRDAPRGVELLLVVACQREEVDAFSRCLRRDCGDEQRGVAQTHHHRAIRLLGDVPGFDDQSLAAEIRFKCFLEIVGDGHACLLVVTRAGTAPLRRALQR